MSLRLGFMGTPDFSVPTLAELLAAGHEVAAVYSQPPRKSGRGHKVTPSPVHQFASDQGLEVRTPLNFKDPSDVAAFQALELECAIVVAYGLILPQALLDAPRFGCLNLHASLLPRWRGAAPIQRAIEAGDRETGVMVMQMEAGLDTGPVLLGERVPIDRDTTAGSLHDTLAQVGASLLPRALAALERGALTATPQPDEGVTYAKKIKPEEARLRWEEPAVVLERRIRAFQPVPGAWFELPSAKGPVRIKVRRAVALEGASAVSPGEIVDSPLTVSCGEGVLRIDEVQRAGKGPCPAPDFVRGLNEPLPDRLA